MVTRLRNQIESELNNLENFIVNETLEQLKEKVQALTKQGKYHKAIATLNRLSNKISNPRVVYHKTSAERFFPWGKGVDCYYKKITFAYPIYSSQERRCGICRRYIIDVVGWNWDSDTPTNQKNAKFHSAYAIFANKSFKFYICKKHRVRVNKRLMVKLLKECGQLGIEGFTESELTPERQPRCVPRGL